MAVWICEDLHFFEGNVIVVQRQTSVAPSRHIVSCYQHP